jgi:hypothetical protein
MFQREGHVVSKERKLNLITNRTVGQWGFDLN